MRSWRAIRSHQRPARRLANDLNELTRAVTDPRSAKDLARVIAHDLQSRPTPSTRDVLAAVAARCSDDAQRSGLAAYLHLCKDFSFETLGDVFGVTADAARRLVERGTGAVPVTAADGCRGWALVAPRPGRTDSELRAASGHLSLCRRCRYRLRAHVALEHRVATVGTAAFGASVTAAIGRAVAGGHVGSAAAGAITGPVVAMSTAAALTVGIGAFAVTTHGGDGTSRHVVTHDVRQHDQPPADEHATPTPADGQQTRPSAPQVGLPGVTPSPEDIIVPSRVAPLPGSTVVPLPQVSPPTLPLPEIRLSPPAATTSPLPIPLPTLTLPPLP